MMRRLFIIRKDLHLTAGKLSAMVGHCCEAYWMNLIKGGEQLFSAEGDNPPTTVDMLVSIPCDIWDEYVNGIFTKTICESRNRNHLMKAADRAKEMGFKEGVDFGFINDCCLTELKPENEDGTTTIGIWFRPLDDDTAWEISKKYPLYREHEKNTNSQESQ